MKYEILYLDDLYCVFISSKMYCSCNTFNEARKTIDKYKDYLSSL